MRRQDRLASLARWLTSPENELFAKSQTNFIWYHLMGQGLVDPIDDFRLTNPPSNPPLLDALARDLVNSGFDIRFPDPQDHEFADVSTFVRTKRDQRA